VTERAPAKINVCLFLGPVRADGRHELVTVVQPVSLFDELEILELEAGPDEVVCPGVEGPNLAGAAIAGFRELTGWRWPAVRVTITKRIPVAGGMAGGSANAGATLRLLSQAAGRDDDEVLHEIARSLGADVPAQVRPARYLATGAGERLERIEDVTSYGVLVLPSDAVLSTGDVYRQADAMGLPRTHEDLDERLAAVRAALPDLPDELVVNDLEAAARAERVLLSGSGPTVLGLFRDPGAAERAAAQLVDRSPPVVAVRTLAAE
jgi:4-diphosphocytidyl-2-C-methyl-D-erythritol kinase